MSRQTPRLGIWCHLTASSCSWHFHFLPSPRSSLTVCIFFPLHRNNTKWQNTHISSITHFICCILVKLHEMNHESSIAILIAWWPCTGHLSRWSEIFMKHYCLKKKGGGRWNEKKVVLWFVHVSFGFPCQSGSFLTDIEQWRLFIIFFWYFGFLCSFWNVSWTVGCPNVSVQNLLTYLHNDLLEALDSFVKLWDLEIVAFF